MIRAGIAYTVPYGDEDDLSKFRLLLEEDFILGLGFCGFGGMASAESGLGPRVTRFAVWRSGFLGFRVECKA